DLAIVVACQLLDDGAHHTARAAPGRPEIDQHQTFLGQVGEVVVGELYEVGHYESLLVVRSQRPGYNCSCWRVREVWRLRRPLPAYGSGQRGQAVRAGAATDRKLLTIIYGAA